MLDPAYDDEDRHSEINLAIHEGRLTERGRRTALRNAKADDARRIKVRQRDAARVARDTTGSVVGPSEQVEMRQDAIAAARELYRKDPRLLSLRLMTALDLPRSMIADIADVTPATVSRSAHRSRRVMSQAGLSNVG